MESIKFREMSSVLWDLSEPVPLVWGLELD